MIVAVASGKGGTGKTTVAVNLAAAADRPVTYVDCDVEEPNGQLFLKPEISSSQPVGVPVPVVDVAKCTGCGRCAEACRYNALACINGTVLLFKELCHGCGGCTLACPTRAISEHPHEIGVVEHGTSGRIDFIQGRLRIGATTAVPLIRAARMATPSSQMTILDAPPGTSCPVVATVRDCSYVILVTEPTPFGLHDLKLAVETIRLMSLPFGVIINRADSGDSRVRDYCHGESIPILIEIPDNRCIAEAYSRGELLIDALPEVRDLFSTLNQRLREVTESAS